MHKAQMSGIMPIKTRVALPLSFLSPSLSATSNERTNAQSHFIPVEIFAESQRHCMLRGRQAGKQARLVPTTAIDDDRK